MDGIADLLPHRRTDGEDWQLICQRDEWPRARRETFFKLVDILEEASLADVAHSRSDPVGMWSTTAADMRIFDTKRAAEQLRYLFYTMEWDTPELQWLTGTAFELLPKRLLVFFVRTLKYLHSKIPEVFDESRLLDYAASSRLGLSSRLKQWVRSHPPLGPATSHPPPPREEVSKDVLVVLAPCEYSWDSPHLRRWKELFQHSWLVEAVNVTMSSTDDTALKKAFLEKLTALQKQHPTRKLVLVGFGVGVKVVVTAAQHKRVGGLICMAMILQSKSLAMESSIVQKDLQQLESPVAFVVGTEATKSSVKALEEARPQMKCAREIISVPGGDDTLRVHLNKKKELRMTQDMIDRQKMGVLNVFIKRYVLRIAASVPAHTAEMMHRAKRHAALLDDPPAKAPKA